MPVNFRHEAVIDLMIACPKMTKGQIALELGYTQAWLSTLINSDAFQMRLAERRQAVAMDLDSAAVKRLHELDQAASEIIAKELEKDEVDPYYALNVKKTVQQGMNPKGNKALELHAQNMQVVQNNTQINHTVLERARNKMRALAPPLTEDDLVAEVTGA